MQKSEAGSFVHQHTYGTWRRQELWQSPMLIVDAEGVYIYDESGRPYPDFSSQLMCCNLGHRNQAIIEAIVKQAERLPYVAPGFATEAMLEAVAALRSVLPESLTKYFFSTSGTEANEAVLDEGIECLDRSLEIADREADDTGVPVSRSSEFTRT